MSLRTAQSDPMLAQARALCAQGRIAEGTERYASMVNRHPTVVPLRAEYAGVLARVGQYDQACRELERAIRLDPHQPLLHHQLYRAQRNRPDLRGARRALDAGLAQHPEDAQLLADLAEWHAVQGDTDSAAAVLLPKLEAGNDHPALSTRLARVARRIGRMDDAVGWLRRSLERNGITPQARADVLFRLAQLLDARGDHDDAWAAAVEANALRAPVYDPDAHKRQVDSHLALWTRDRLEALPRACHGSRKPVFIVGMPRSGTTLVEQIIDAHPDAHGAGELRLVHERMGELASHPGSSGLEFDAATINRTGGKLADRMARLAPRASRVVDKQPANYLHLGLLSRLVPEASFIHCVRDPRDTCLSCYLLDFAGGVDFASDLGHLGRYHRQYQRVMSHWRDTLDVPVLDVVYEDVTRDPEPNIRRIVEFTGLEWDDACMESHRSSRPALTASNAQVTQPIYTSSVARWKHYEPHLGELFDALGRSGEAP